MKKYLILLLVCILCACSHNSHSDFVIEGTTLIEYTGNEAEIIVPDNVTRIGASAFETNEQYPKDEIKKITVPGTVEVIEGEAFAFCYADVIVIEEGCKELGDRAFMDSYPTDVTLPESLITIGYNLFETEEGLRDTKFHVVEGSAIDRALKEQDPYGSYTIVYD